MRALVTGGGGFLGRYLVEQLQSAGWSVRSLSRRRYPELEQAGVEVISADLRDREAVISACHGCDAVFHAAALPGIWGPWKTYYETNTVGTEAVIAGCRQAGVGRLIYTSSPSVVYDGREHFDADESLPYPSSYLCHYPRSKALAEQRVLAANDDQLQTVALRPHLIWGPRDNHLIPRLIQRAKQGRLIQVGSGGNRVSMSYVENVAAAHLLAAETLHPGAAHAGRAYFINEPQSVVLWDWVNELLDLADLPPVRRRISSRTAWMIGRIMETVYGTLRLSAEPPMTRFLAQQLSTTHTYSIARAEADFGYRPQISIAEGMHRLTPDLERLGRPA